MEVVRRDPLAAAHPHPAMIKRLLSRDNLLALLLCLLAVLLLIVTTDSAPQWIYQGF